MKESTAIRLLEEFKPLKIDGKSATSIWAIYVADTHPIRNSRTKDPTFDNSEGKTRWSIHTQVVHLSVKTPNGWFNKKSYGKIDGAYSIMVNAAKTISSPLEAKWRDLFEKKNLKDKDNESKKKDKELDELCNKYAFAIVSSLDYNLFLTARKDNTKAKPLLDAINSIASEIREDVLSKKDVAAERFSIVKNRIPIGLMFMSEKSVFTWEEEIYGKIYTIEMKSLGGNCMTLNIGSTNSVIIPTHEYSQSYDFKKRSGDAFLQAVICYDEKSGNIMGSVKNIFTTEKNSRGGLTVSKIWCDVTKKLGMERWIADYVTEGGNKFIQALVKNGRVKVLAIHGSKYILSC